LSEESPSPHENGAGGAEAKAELEPWERACEDGGLRLRSVGADGRFSRGGWSECGYLPALSGKAGPMISQILTGALISFLNFGIHALLTGVIVVLTNHVAGATDELHVFTRLIALLTVTVTALMIAHLAEIGVWAAFIRSQESPCQTSDPLSSHSSEHYVALGYGDVVASDGWRLIGPIMSLMDCS